MARTILVLFLLGFAIGAATGSHIALAQANCWCKDGDCDCNDGLPSGCFVTSQCKFVQTCPDPSNNCALDYGWCLHTECTECHTQAPAPSGPGFPLYAWAYQSTSQEGCQYNPQQLCDVLC